MPTSARALSTRSRSTVAALHDAEQRPPRLVAERDAAALGPAQRQAHGVLDRLVGGGQPHAFVELHLDVGAQKTLDFDGALGRQHMGRAVDVRLEGDAGLVDFAQLRQRHDLEAAGVGEDRERPVHEAVQPAHPGDALRAGPQHEVIDVAEHHVGPEPLHLIRVHGLDGRRRADRHEGRRADHPARHPDFADARRAVGFRDREGEGVGHAGG